MSLSQLPIEVIIERIERTTPEDLRGAAKGFETAEDELFQVRGRMNGVTSDTHTMWDSGAGRSFATASEQVVKGLAEVGYTLGYLARLLRAHADATDQARAELQPFRTPNPVPGTHPYFHPDAIKQSKVDAIAVRFHESERRVRDALFTRGEQAPGGIPVPDLPVRPEPSWWEALFGPGPEWTWLDAEGNPLPLLGDNSGKAAYGYDEDGNLVPAHRAAYPVEHYYALQSGVPLGAVFRWLRRAPGGPYGVQNGDEFVEALVQSKGWRGNVEPLPEAPSHRQRHIREFFNLPDGPPGQPPPPPPAWAETEYLKLLRTAAENSGKVFRYSTEGTPTNAILYRDPDTQKWLVVQFYREGEFAGQYATSFTPTPHQLNQMLQANALK
jgi:hypothetical protein